MSRVACLRKKTKISQLQLLNDISLPVEQGDVLPGPEGGMGKHQTEKNEADDKQDEKKVRLSHGINPAP
jgi:hypothetical protein